MQSLFFITAVNGISLYAQHIPGKHNSTADALSHNHLPLFHQQVLLANSHPTPIPPKLWKILVLNQPVRAGEVSLHVFFKRAIPLHSENLQECSRLVSKILYQVSYGTSSYK